MNGKGIRYRNVLDRRTLLRGAGSIAIGLPFLEEMSPRSVWAAGNPVPARCITLFFGLGIDPAHQDEKFAGPLKPYEVFKDKMAFFTHADMSQAAGGLVHIEGSTVIFVGEKRRAQERSGGASIDQIMRKALHPNGVPTALGSLAAGLWFRELSSSQPSRCWNADGSLAEMPIKRPTKLFDRVFGNYKPPVVGGTPPPSTDPVAEREARIQRSVLDTVLAQYQSLSQDASPLGKSSKQKLQNHLERIREVEKRLAPIDNFVQMMDQPGTPQVPAMACKVPTKPGDPDLNGVSYELKGATDGGAPQMSHQQFGAAFRLLADIYALAVRCDIVRFGNLMCEDAGGHVKFTGDYSALGQTLKFTGQNSEHGGFQHNNDKASARIVAHMFQEHLAYFMGQLDDRQHLEANGKTVLENSLVVTGTEVGWNHSLTDVHHGIAGGQGHFKPGFYQQPVNVVDIYNTILKPFGIDANIGAGLGKGEISSLLA